MDENKSGTMSTEKNSVDANKLQNAFVLHAFMGALLSGCIAFFKPHILIVFLFAAVIMGSYFWQYIKGGKPNSLLTMFSDSIYYLGFLLTLTSLVFSMLFFNIEEGVTSASVIISQFGAALITTLLGMGIRIYLQNFDTTVESAQLSARESLDETVKGFNIQMRSTNQALSKLSDSMNKNIEDAEKRNNKSIEMFDETQKKLTSLGEASLAEFAKSTEKVLSESISKLEVVSNQLSEKFTHTSDTLLKESNSQFSNINKSILESLQTQFESLNKGLTESFKTARSSSQELGSSVGEVRASLRKLGSTAKDTSEKISLIEHFSPDVKTLEENQSAYIKSLKTLSDEVSARTESLLKSEFKIEKHMKDVAEDYKKVIENYQQIVSSGSAEKLVEEEESLLKAIKARVSSVEQLSQQWENEVKAMSSHSKEFSENLVRTAKFITHEMNSTTHPSKEAVNG